MDIQYTRIDLMRYAEDNIFYPSETYRHVVLSATQHSMSDNRIQCEVFYSMELEKCKNTARILKSHYESYGYYAFNIYVDGELTYSSDKPLNFNDQNKSFRYFVET